MKQQPQPLSSGLSLPARVREGVAFVAKNATFVRIRQDMVADYTAALLQRYPVITSLDAENHFMSEASPAATVAFVLALDSVNFGSGYFAAAKAAGVELEYNVVAGCLRKAFAASRMNTPQKWQVATPADCHEIFCIPQGRDEKLDDLMALFAQHLRTTGDMLVKNYGGEALALVEDSRNSAVRLAEIVGGWPTFRDIAVYKNVEIPFYKRAQILASDIHLAFKGGAPAAFKDMGELTSFADNMVPHVLRCGGILEYAPDLAARIDNGEMIAFGSSEEIELRACALHAVELMKATAANVTSVNIDHILWNKGYERDIYAQPSHRTMTVWY